jgi:hypothetical protein
VTVERRTRWWARSKGADRTDARPAAADDPLAPPVLPDPPPPAGPAPVPPLRPAARELAEKITELLADAARRGLPAAPLRDCVVAALGRDPFTGPAESPVTTLIEGLARLDGPALRPVEDGVAAFAARSRAAASPIAVVSDPGAGTTWLWWGAQEQAAAREGGPEAVALAGIRTDGSLTVLVRTVADPKPDLRKVLTSRAVGQALDRLGRAPDEPALRAAAVSALSRTPVPDGADWAVALSGPQPRTGGPALPDLGGTVAVVSSVAARIGSRTVRRSALLHTVSPTPAAAMLLADNPELVTALVDVVSGPGDGGAGEALQAGLVGARPPDMAASAAAREAGTVFRAPEAGTTVRITGAPGPDLRRRAAGKNRYLLAARTAAPTTPTGGDRRPTA